MADGLLQCHREAGAAAMKALDKRRALGRSLRVRSLFVKSFPHNILHYSQLILKIRPIGIQDKP